MNYVPLALFFAATTWIVWRGYQAKRTYLKQPRENFGDAEYLFDLLR